MILIPSFWTKKVTLRERVFKETWSLRIHSEWLWRIPSGMLYYTFFVRWIKQIPKRCSSSTPWYLTLIKKYELKWKRSSWKMKLPQILWPLLIEKVKCLMMKKLWEEVVNAKQHSKLTFRICIQKKQLCLWDPFSLEVYFPKQLTCKLRRLPTASSSHQ